MTQEIVKTTSKSLCCQSSTDRTDRISAVSKDLASERFRGSEPSQHRHCLFLDFLKRSRPPRMVSPACFSGSRRLSRDVAAAGPSVGNKDQHEAAICMPNAERHLSAKSISSKVSGERTGADNAHQNCTLRSEANRNATTCTYSNAASRKNPGGHKTKIAGTSNHDANELKVPRARRSCSAFCVAFEPV